MYTDISFSEVSTFALNYAILKNAEMLLLYENYSLRYLRYPLEEIGITFIVGVFVIYTAYTVHICYIEILIVIFLHRTHV